MRKFYPYGSTNTLMALKVLLAPTTAIRLSPSKLTRWNPCTPPHRVGQGLGVGINDQRVDWEITPPGCPPIGVHRCRLFGQSHSIRASNPPSPKAFSSFVVGAFGSSSVFSEESNPSREAAYSAKASWSAVLTEQGLPHPLL